MYYQVTHIHDYTLIIVSVCIWLFTYLKFKKSSGCYTINDYFWLVILLSIYSVFSYAELDFYGYYNLYDFMVATQDRIHVEGFYFYLAQIIPNYYVWRFLIWGTGAFIIVYLIRKENVKPDIVGILFPAFFFVQYSITRGSLGFSVILLLIYYYYNARLKIIGVVVFVLGLFVAFKLHHSIPLFVAILLLSMLIPLNRKVLCVSIILFPFIYTGLGYVFDYFVGIGIFSDETKILANHYYTDESREVNLSGVLGSVITWFPRLLMLYLIVKRYVLEEAPLSRTMNLYMKYSFLLIYCSMLFMGQNLSSFMSPRAFQAASFPLLIITSNYYTEKEELEKWDIYVIRAFLFSQLFSFLYLYVSWSR